MKKQFLSLALFLTASSFQNLQASAVNPAILDFYGHILGEHHLKHRYTSFYIGLNSEIKKYFDEAEDLQLATQELAEEMPGLCERSSLKFFEPSGSLNRIFSWWTRRALAQECKETTNRWIEKVRSHLGEIQAED